MKPWLKWLIVLLAVLAVAWVVRGRLLVSKPVDVDVVLVDRGAVEATVTNSKAGTVRTRHRARLSPEISGRVIRAPFAEGDLVKKGDILLELDGATLSAQATKARRDIATASAEKRRACLAAEQATRELNRYRELSRKSEIVSVDLLDQLESKSATAAAACDAAGLSVESARAQLAVVQSEKSKCVLRAPFSGVVAEIDAEVGEWVTPSPPAVPVPPVVEIIDTGSIFVSAPMDEVDSNRLAAGQSVRVTLDPFPDRSFAGRVARVAPYVLDIERQNRTVEIEVELDDREFSSRLLPGTSADVEVILERSDDVLRVPTSVLLEGPAVFVVLQGRIEKRAVETGLRNWQFVEVRQGLAEGDAIVASLDRTEVVPGAEVKVRNADES